MSSRVRLDRPQPEVMVLTILREARRNALDPETVDELLAALEAAAADQAMRAVIVTGEGTAAFCAGSDLKAQAAMTPPQRQAHDTRARDLMERLQAHPCVVIAAVEGYALGGGFELALACDLIVAGEGAVFGFPELPKQMLPAWGGTFRLVRSIGVLPAKALIMGGRRWSAAEAAAAGIVLEVAAQGRAAEQAQRIAATLAAASSRETYAQAKALIGAGAHISDQAGRALEAAAEALLTES